MLTDDVRKALYFEAGPDSLPAALQYETVARRVVQTLFDSDDTVESESLRFDEIVTDVAKMIARVSCGKKCDISVLTETVTKYLEHIALLREVDHE